MKLYKTTFDYNESSSALKEITIPTNIKYQLGVKVTKDGTRLDGDVTLNDGTDNIQPTKVDEGYAIFDLECGDDAKADKTFAVKFNKAGYEKKVVVSSPSTDTGTYTHWAFPMKGLLKDGKIDLSKIWIQYQPTGFDEMTDNFVEKKYQKQTYNSGRYPCASGNSDLSKYRGVKIAKSVEDLTSGIGYAIIPKTISGEPYLVECDGTQTGRTNIPNDAFEEIADVDLSEYENGYMFFGFSASTAPTYTFYFGETTDVPMKANFKGVVVNQEEFDVVDVPDEISELSYIDDEGEKVTIEAEDIATKEEVETLAYSPIKSVATTTYIPELVMTFLDVKGEMDNYTWGGAGTTDRWMFKVMKTGENGTFGQVRFWKNDEEYDTHSLDDEYTMTDNIEDAYVLVDSNDTYFVTSNGKVKFTT